MYIKAYLKSFVEIQYLKNDIYAKSICFDVFCYETKLYFYLKDKVEIDILLKR